MPWLAAMNDWTATEPVTQVPTRPASRFIAAVLWASGVMLFISMLAIVGREAMREIPPLHLMFWRSSTALLMLIALHVALGWRLSALTPRRPLLHLWRASTHFCGQAGWFIAISMIPLAQVFALEFSYPLLMVLLAPVVLGERLTALRLTAVLIGFAGIVLAVRPFDMQLGPGVLAGLFCAVGYAFSSLAMKDLTRTDTSTSILVSMALIQALIALPPTLWTWTVPSPRTWGLIGLAAIAGVLAQYCMTRAYALADAVVVGPLDFFRLPLIALVGLFVYSEALDPWVLAGGGVIVVANLINILGERRSR